MLDVFKMKKLGIFAGGVLFGTAGVKLLSSKDAKKVYTNCTAAVLRAKDSVMKTASTVQENAEDILAEAKQINEERAAKEAALEQEAEEVTEETVADNTDFASIPGSAPFPFTVVACSPPIELEYVRSYAGESIHLFSSSLYI